MSRAKKLSIELAIPNMSIHETLHEKIDAIYYYLKIYSIQCKHRTKIDTKTLPKDHASIEVTDINVPGGLPSYIKHLLNETLDFFRSNTMKLLEDSNGSLDDFHDMLNKATEKCISAYKEFDISNSLTFDHTFIYRVAYKRSWIVRPLSSLLLNEEQLATINTHFCMRRDFFGELSQIFQAEQQRLVQSTEDYNSNNIWITDDGLMEVAALALALEALRLDFKNKGDKAIFIKQLYNMFGLDGKGHAQRVQNLRRLKNRSSYLRELVDYIEQDIIAPRLPAKTKIKRNLRN